VAFSSDQQHPPIKKVDVERSGWQYCCSELLFRSKVRPECGKRRPGEREYFRRIRIDVGESTVMDRKLAGVGETADGIGLVDEKLEDKLIDYALRLKWSDINERAIWQAKRRLIDTIGAAIAAYPAPPSRIARRIAQAVSEGPRARVWGSMEVTSPEAAAFANVVMLRYLDFNDTYRAKDGAHPSDNIGALISAGEAVGASGRDFLLALIVAYEIHCRFVDVVPFNDSGWDQPIPSAIACVLAVGRLWELTPVQLRHALSLTIVPNLCTYQTRAGELSMWKGCATANGARQAIFAVRLAAEGMTGPSEPFDGVFGLWKQTMGRRYEIAPLATGSATFAVQQSNLKLYPVRDSCQLAVNTAKDLRTKLNANDLASLKIVTYKSAHKGAIADPELWAPKTRETADHSMPVSIAATLIDGTVTPDTFERARFLDEDVLALIGKMDVEVSEKFSAEAPGRRNCRLEARDVMGTLHVSHLTLSDSEIEQGLSDDDVWNKFRLLTKRFLPPSEQENLLSTLQGVENVRDISEVVSLLRI
jgi:2-methylcitrate dehydratase